MPFKDKSDATEHYQDILHYQDIFLRLNPNPKVNLKIVSI